MDDEELDELRRRIYHPDATDEDRERYRVLLGRAQVVRRPQPVVPAGLGPEAVADPDPDPTPLSRRRRRLVVLTAAIAVLALVAGGLALLPRAPTPPPSPPLQPIAVDAAMRTELVENLARGEAAGVATYLVTREPPPALRAATRLHTIERNGIGPGAFSLSGTPAETESGRATVFLVLQVDGRASWTAYRVREQADDPSPLQAVERRGGNAQAGGLTATTFRYPSGGRPVRVEVDVPAGVRWGAAVVLSD